MITDRERILALIDNDCLWPSDAIILLEGDGIDRYRKAASLYKEGWASKIVLSGNIADYNYGSIPLSEVQTQMRDEGVPEADIICEDKSLNTRELAVEIVKMAQENGWKKLILVASHDQQYRAYLLFLREVLDTRSGIILYNTPARNIDWFVDNGWGTRIERLKDEIYKIEKYSEMGYLANVQEVIDYQKLKESQYPPYMY